MGRLKRTPGPRATLVGAVLIWFGVVIVVGVHASPPQDNAVRPSKAAATTVKGTSPKPADPSTVTAGEYVGEEKCLECHEDQGKGYHNSPHGRAKNLRTPAAKNTCETCHGPGKAHVEADGDGHIKDFKTMAPRQVGETCTTCHARSEHNNWAGGKHDSRNMSCTTCHSVHESKSVEAQLKKQTVTETCVQCHKGKWRRCIGRRTCRFAKASWNARRVTTRMVRRTSRCCAKGTRSMRPARPATPKSEDRSSGSTPPAARTA